MTRKDIICTCMEITRGEISVVIKSNSLKSVDEVGEATEAGTVCGFA